MDWYIVEFDEMAVHRRVSPLGQKPWSDYFYWHDIIRTCFKAGGFLEQDELYIFTNQRQESYLIPTEATGGSALIGELVRRGLFSVELMLEATQHQGELYCHPKP
ncbi:MAG: hypothetical protein ACK41E_00700 [Deinococcales bacterium]